MGSNVKKETYDRGTAEGCRFNCLTGKGQNACARNRYFTTRHPKKGGTRGLRDALQPLKKLSGSSFQVDRVKKTGDTGSYTKRGERDWESLRNTQSEERDQVRAEGKGG